jgi:hypothetical protein
MLLGFFSLLKPLSFPGFSSYLSGLAVCGFGLFVISSGFLLPAKEVRIESRRTQLDAFSPAYHFHEVHSIRVKAPRDKIFLAIHHVTAREIFLFRALTWIRRFGRQKKESILNAPPDEPILDVAALTGFLKLADERNTEVVLGTLVVSPAGRRSSGNASFESFANLNAPGFAKAMINFRIEGCDSSGCLVETETRVFGTDRAAVRKFAPYWRTIYPGSALIRRMWLRAIRKREEATSD